MSHPLSFNPVLRNLPVYQPGRPIEEVARELGLPPDNIIKLASRTKTRWARRRLAAAAMTCKAAGRA